MARLDGEVVLAPDGARECIEHGFRDVDDHTALVTDEVGMAAVAKARAGTTGTLAVQEALQMHGGIGMTDQFDIGLFMKRMRVCQELFGDSNYQGEQLALMRSY